MIEKLDSGIEIEKVVFDARGSKKWLCDYENIRILLIHSFQFPRFLIF